jgi:hypothetical protein
LQGESGAQESQMWDGVSGLVADCKAGEKVRAWESVFEESGEHGEADDDDDEGTLKSTHHEQLNKGSQWCEGDGFVFLFSFDCGVLFLQFSSYLRHPRYLIQCTHYIVCQ